MNNFHAVGRIAAEIKLIGSNTLTGKIKTIAWMQQMIIIMMTVAFLDMNMRTRGTFSKCFM